MPRPQRYVPPDSLLDLGSRTVQGLPLLPPTEEVRDAILGVLGYALFLYPEVQLHAFICLTNHFHMYATASDPETLARFMSFFKGNVARKVSKIIGWSGPFWDRRYTAIPVVDDVAAVDRLDYIFQNSCKEGLVSSPLDWCGATTARALTLGEPLRGKWVNQTELSNAWRRWERTDVEERGAAPDPEEFAIWFTITLTPLPCWRDKPEGERKALCQAIVDRIESEMEGVTVVGVERLRRVDPDRRPAKPRPRSSIPKCHAATIEGWREFVHPHRQLREIYRNASRRLLAGESATLPPWTLPPPGHFTPARNRLPRTWEAVQAAASGH